MDSLIHPLKIKKKYHMTWTVYKANFSGNFGSKLHDFHTNKSSLPITNLYCFYSKGEETRSGLLRNHTQFLCWKIVPLILVTQNQKHATDPLKVCLILIGETVLFNTTCSSVDSPSSKSYQGGEIDFEPQ
jgi:hypothetical protein